MEPKEVIELKHTIYIDVLISLNLFVNYFILLAVAKFLYLKPKRSRLIFGAFVGAIYSLYIILPEPNVLISLLIKLIMSFTIVSISFGLEKRILSKPIVCFYLISLSFSGLNFIMWILFKPNGMIVNNGIVYFNISPIVLIISTLVSYFLIELINKFLGRHICSELFCHVKIKFNNNTSEFDAKLDTGNSLKEPFSNLPVIIVDRNKIKEVVPCEISKTKLRLIPFSNVSDSGFLIGFKPDNILIETNSGRTYEPEAYIGICDKQHLKYALIGSNIMDNF